MSSIKLFSASVDDYESVLKIFKAVVPDECYHLAAQSYVSYLFDDEHSTLKTNINGTQSVLSALKNAVPDCKFYFAASSEMFGDVKETPQNEDTPFYPRSIYGISKVAGFELTSYYRKVFGIHASSGILYNHESERRSQSFVTRKITLGVSKIICGIDEKLELGNLDARRDWGYAPEYVNGMWRMIQNEKPYDIILSTNETHSVKEFVEKSFEALSDEIIWIGNGINVKGILKSTGKEVICVNPKYYRENEAVQLIGENNKAKLILGWRPEVEFEEIVRSMVIADFNRIKSKC